MKKLLLMLACLMSAVIADAQDIIVKSDGSTIQAKVQKVTSTEVEYKKFSNQDGPTYTIKTSELLSINYQNGERDTFGGSTQQNSVFNPNIVTNETATRFSNDKELMGMYYSSKDYERRAKTWKIAGFVSGGALLCSGAILMLCPAEGDYDASMWIGGSLMGAGVISGLVCLAQSNRCKKIARGQIYSSIILEKEFKINNGNSLALGVDALNDNVNNSRGLGVGLRLNF